MLVMNRGIGDLSAVQWRRRYFALLAVFPSLRLNLIWGLFQIRETDSDPASSSSEGNLSLGMGRMLERLALNFALFTTL